MWFKENKACNFSLNCPLWFWFFFPLPVTIKEFCSDVDTQGRNSLKSSSISCSCLNNFWDAVVSGGLFFGRGVVCFLTTLKQGLRAPTSKDRPRQAGCLTAFLKAFMRFLCRSHSIFLWVNPNVDTAGLAEQVTQYFLRIAILALTIS